MTLANTELVYQADFMNVSPSADGAVFSGIGNRIITGLVPSLINGAVQVTAGKALVQGRLFELTATKTYTPTATTGTQYLGLMVDLTKSNVDGNTVTNNQYTVGFFDNPSGNLPMGDSKANIPLFKMTGTTSVMVAPEMNGSTVRTWQPNTQYSIGDLVTFNSLGTDTTGKLTNPIFRAVQTHVSDATFPASTNTQWQLVNVDAYHYEQTIKPAGVISMILRRDGKMVQIAPTTPTTGNLLSWSSQWVNLGGTVPSGFTPTYGADVMASSGQRENMWTWRFNSNNSIQLAQMWGSNTTLGAGVYFNMTGLWITQDNPVWNAGTPS